MKLIYSVFCIVMILVVVTSCDRQYSFENNSAQSTFETVTNVPETTDLTESYDNKVIAEGEHYKLVSHNLKRTTYYIYDTFGNIVAEEYNDQFSVTIGEENNVVAVRKGLGNGPSETFYYSVERDIFSPTYYDVAAFENGLVIYPEPDGTAVVIESIFDDSIYQTIDCRLDMSFRKAIQNAYFENGSAVVEYKCFINEDSDKTVVKKEIVPLYPSVK